MKRVFALLACLTPVACSVPSLADAQRRPDLPRVEAIVLEGTNQFRRTEHLESVQPNPRLDDAAREFAAFMARTGKFEHDADGRQPHERALAHGYRYCFIAENLSYQYSTADFRTDVLAQRLVDGWKNSPSHRKNMLRDGVTETAVAVARAEGTGTPRYYAVQLFARPRPATGCGSPRAGS